MCIYKVICNMRNQDLIAQQAYSSLQLRRISFSALMRPAVAASLPALPRQGSLRSSVDVT